MNYRIEYCDVKLAKSCISAEGSASKLRIYDPKDMRPSQGLLRPGRFLWARALPWSIVLGLALWVTYKSFKGVGIGLGLSGTGLPTAMGVLAALALYIASVRLIERRTADELGLRRLAPELALGGAWARRSSRP